jgi:hypothetical protein
MSDYDTDILRWSEHQARFLRRLGAGEQVNSQIDWDNVVEEIESVGREQLHAVESLLTQALIHMLKRAFKILGCWRDTVRFKAHGKGGSGGDVGVAGDVGGGASAWRHDGD